MKTGKADTRTRQFRIYFIICAIAYVIEWIAPFVADISGQAQGSAENLANLRNSSNFDWSTIALFGAVSFAYSLEMDRKNWSGVLAGLAFFFMDAFNEIWNGLIFTATGQYSAYWMCGYTSSYQTMIGWNIEIMFCFLFFGLCVTKNLPKDKNMLFFGKINNRIAIAFAWAMLGFIVELILNSFNALIWNYPWRSARFPVLIMISAYMPFTGIAIWVYDLPERKQQIKLVGAMAIAALIAVAVFIPLGWI